MTSRAHDRRGFLHGILAAGAVTAAALFAWTRRRSRRHAS